MHATSSAARPNSNPRLRGCAKSSAISSRPARALRFGDALSAAQGDLYGVNADVSRLETEIRFVADTRQRLDAQLAQLRGQRDTGLQSELEQREALRACEARLQESRDALERARRKLADEQEKLPQAEQAARLLQGRIAGERERIAQAEQAFQVEQAHLAHAGKTLQGLEQREEKLLAERSELVAPDAQLRSHLAQELSQSGTELSRQEALLAQLETAREALDGQRRGCVDSLQLLERELSALEAGCSRCRKYRTRSRRTARSRIGSAGTSSRQNRACGRKIRVEAGWETAVESALRERLHAMEMSDPELLQRLLEDPPPARVSAYLRGTDSKLSSSLD